MDFRNKIICSDCREALGAMADESIHCCVCSPPYWRQRDYFLPPVMYGGKGDCGHDWQEQRSARRGGANKPDNPPNTGGNRREQSSRVRTGGVVSYSCPKCGGWIGTLGGEASPWEYVNNLVEIFSYVMRVLRKDGVAFIVIGDTYIGGGRGGNPEESAHRKQATNRGSLISRAPVPDGLKPKDLALVPERLAIALQAAGWYLRSVIIWDKVNPMCQNVKDRPTTAHEYILLLSKSARYFYDWYSMREPAVTQPYRNMRTVWRIPRGSYPGHYAVFPPKLARRMILAGTSDRVCQVCGAPWVRPKEPLNSGSWLPGCDCDDNDGSGKALVMDPMSGSGTSCAVAAVLKRDFLGIDLSPAYCEIARFRTAQALQEAAQEELDLDNSGRIC